MLCTQKTNHSSDSSRVFLGRTLPSLLDEGCDRDPNADAFYQWTGTGWRSLSNQAFRANVEATALGLLSLGLEQGDRIALLMHSDINFCTVDLGCLLANLVDVPIDLTQTLEHILFELQHSEAKVLVISNVDLLTQILPYLQDTPALQYILVVDVPADWQQTRSGWMADSSSSDGHSLDLRSTATALETACLDIPMLLHPTQGKQFHPPLPPRTLPQCIQALSLAEVQAQGRAIYSTSQLQQLRADLTPDRLATIVYIPDAVGQMQGVMLTHENLATNALAAFAALPELGRGAQEVVLSFLPLNHVLARALLYGHINYGHSIYFSNPNRVLRHLQEVRPTVLVTVPLLLEKIYSKVVEKGSKWTKCQNLWEFLQLVFTQAIFNWSLQLAHQYEVGRSPKGLYALLLKLADRLVLSKWRSLFGDRLKYLICGGAALKAELANVFAAVGIPIMHGYGLTQASAVVCCNRGALNRAGTVGLPIAGVEVAIAEDSEILVRGASVTPGYYKNPEATQAMIDPAGWLHTGDLGAFTQEGFLKITGLKKALFKLSTGKYIAPYPIEERLKQSPLVTHSVVVGADRKFCAVLIAPNLEALHHHAQVIGFDLTDEELLQHPCTLALYQSLVDAANCHLPYWAIVKRFRLINADFTVENALLTPMQTIDRVRVSEVFASDIEALYRDDASRRDPSSEASIPSADAVACPTAPAATCPAFARSLNPRLTTLNAIAPLMLYTNWAVTHLQSAIAG
jgi:long-chain acyl-CoA synthetase